MSSRSGRGEGLDRLKRIRDCGDAVKKTRGRCRTHTRHELENSKSGKLILENLEETQQVSRKSSSEIKGIELLVGESSSHLASAKITTERLKSTPVTRGSRESR